MTDRIQTIRYMGRPRKPMSLMPNILKLVCDELREQKNIIKKVVTRMDKQIRKIEKDNKRVKTATKKVGGELKHLETADKKRDKFVDAGKKAMKKGC